MQNKNRGLTLIELVIVIALVAILAVVGMPAYKTYTIESRRADAINTIRENQLIVEAYLQQNGVTPTSGQVTLATVSPAGFYNMTYNRVSSTRYSIVATAVSTLSQNGDTGCTVLTLTSEMDGIYPAKCK